MPRLITYGERAEDSGTPAAVLEAGDLCQTAAANLADLFDRYDADWNDATAEELDTLWRGINALHTDALKLLGMPRVRGSNGGLVPHWAELAKRRTA